MNGWNKIIFLQDHMHPGWRTDKPRSLFTTGLASEVGGVCDQVTHLDGGGSRILDPQKWNEKKLLHDLCDSWVMIVLTAERSGFTEDDFLTELSRVLSELNNRKNEHVKARNNGGHING